MPAEKRAAPQRQRLPWLILSAITLGVAAAQIYFGLRPEVGFDETWHIYEGAERGLWRAFLAMSGDNHPPLHYLLIRAALQLGSDPIYARLPSIIATVLTVPLWYALLRKLGIRVAVALTATLILALSYDFLHLGVVVRAYSIAIMLILGALWFWTDLLPNTRGRPSRGSTIAALALFSLAFWTLYSAVFATIAIITATLMLMAVSRPARTTILHRLRTYSAWPEWLLFVFAHLACFGWYAITWGAHMNFGAPDHAVPYTLAEGQSALAFLVTGLHREISLFTPAIGLGDWVANLELIAIVTAALWLSIIKLRKGNVAVAILALTPLVLTAILACLALLGRYPLGGAMRHQYVLFPFLLLLLPVTIEQLWQRVDKRVFGVVAIIVIVVIAIINLQRSLDSRRIGQPAVSLAWTAEFSQLFDRARDEPTLIPAVSFFPMFYQRLPSGIVYETAYAADRLGYHRAYQGWLAIAMPWPAYQQYRITTDDGGELSIIKDHYRWLFDVVPDELFFTQTRQLMTTLGQTRLRVFALQQKPNAKPQDEPGLRAAATANGFAITEYTPLTYGAVWTLELSPAAGTDNAQPARDQHPGPQDTTR